MQNVSIWWILRHFQKAMIRKVCIWYIERHWIAGPPNSGEGYWRNFESPLNLIEQFTFRPPPLLVFNFLREKKRHYFVLTERASVTGAFREEIQFVLVEQICAVSRVVGLGMENHNPPYFPQSHIEIQSPTQFFTHYTCVFKYSNVMASKCATLIHMCPVDQTHHKYIYVPF